MYSVHSVHTLSLLSAHFTSRASQVFPSPPSLFCHYKLWSTLKHKARVQSLVHFFFFFISSQLNQLPVSQLSKPADAAAESKAICSIVHVVSRLKGVLVFLPSGTSVYVCARVCVCIADKVEAESTARHNWGAATHASSNHWSMSNTDHWQPILRLKRLWEVVSGLSIHINNTHN